MLVRIYNKYVCQMLFLSLTKIITLFFSLIKMMNCTMLAAVILPWLSQWNGIWNTGLQDFCLMFSLFFIWNIRFLILIPKYICDCDEYGYSTFKYFSLYSDPGGDTNSLQDQLIYSQRQNPSRPKSWCLSTDWYW